MQQRHLWLQSVLDISETQKLLDRKMVPCYRDWQQPFEQQRRAMAPIGLTPYPLTPCPLAPTSSGPSCRDSLHSESQTSLMKHTGRVSKFENRAICTIDLEHLATYSWYPQASASEPRLTHQTYRRGYGLSQLLSYRSPKSVPQTIFGDCYEAHG